MGSKLSIFLAILLGANGFIILCQRLKINDLQEQIIHKDACISDMKRDVVVSLKILKTQTWYVVNENKISSLPNGQGEIVNLLDRPLLSTGNRLGICYPIPNKKVLFSPSESRGQAYTVEGGWLTYKYLD